MADAQTIAKAIIEIGTSGIPDAEANIRALEADMRQLEKAYQDGQIELPRYATKTAKLARDLEALKGGVDLARQALAQQTATAFQATGSASAWGAAIAQATQKTADFTAQLKAEEAALLSTLVPLNKVQIAAVQYGDKLKKTSTEGKASTRNLGQGFLELSRAFEDASYGLRGVLNNIPTTIQMFGGPAGLAAAVSGAAVAFSILAPHIQEYLKEIGLLGEKTPEAIDALERLRERAKELSEKPLKLAVDTLELEEAKKRIKELEEAQRAYEAAGQGKTVFEQEAGEQFTGNFAQAGQQGVQARNAIRGRILAELLAQSPALAAVEKRRQEAAKAIKAAEERLQFAQPEERAGIVASIQTERQAVKDAEERARQTRLALENQAERQTGSLFAGAGAGNNAAARKELVRRLHQVGEHNLAAMTELSNPAEMERQHTIENDEADAIDRLKAAKALAKKHADKLTEGLNRQGQEGEGPARRDAAKIKADLDKQVSHITSAFGPKYAEPLKAAAFGRLAKGQTDAEIAKALKQQVQGALRAGGVDNAKIAQEAASKIVANVMDGLRAGLMTLGPNVQANAKNALADLNIKREHREDQGERTRGIEALTQQIQANSLGATGVQFTEEQARAAAKATADMVDKNVNFNAALQSALSQQLMAMHEMGSRLLQQQQQMQALASGFGKVNRDLRTRQRTALSTPGG